MPGLGTMDTLMINIAKALPSNESTNEKFTAGSVSKVQPQKDLSEQMKQAKLALNKLEIPSIPGVSPRLEEVAPVAKPAPAAHAQVNSVEWSRGGVDTNVESFISDAVTKVNLILMDLQKREGQISAEIASLRGAQDYNKAKNLRYAYKSLRYAIDDLKDACELVKSLLE